MKTKQHTISKEVSVTGVGLHTGVFSTMTFVPAKTNHGIAFQRVDLPEQPVIEADVDNVVDTSRGTTIAKGEARVHTIEHVLAALVGLEIDNILIQIDGPEPPILDGSSALFVKTLLNAGLEEQNAPRNFFELKEGVFFRDSENKIELAALPLNDYRLTVMVDYDSAVLGSQYATLNSLSEFVHEISPCRTFCFLHEIEDLYSRNLIKGGDINNAIVLVDRVLSREDVDRIAKMMGKESIEVKEEGTLNNIQLHFKNEPARHKLLDMMGDLALVGRPLKGQIMAARPGHKANVGLAKKIKTAMLKAIKNEAPVYDPTIPPLMDAMKIGTILPHRYPFALLDKITYMDDKVVIGVKNVTLNEAFFQGHFPGNPIMPGVLQIEALAQNGGILVLSSVPDPENYWTYFLGIDECRFRKPVLPGDTLIFKCELLAPVKRGIAKMKGQAFVNGQVVCEATVSASIIRKSVDK